MKTYILIGGVIGHTPISNYFGHMELPGFTGQIPIGNFYGWANSMGFTGVIIHM